MNNLNNTYNQGPIPPPMPILPNNQSRPGVFKGRGNLRGIYDGKFSQYAIVVYFIALVIVNVMYSEYSLPWYYMLSGIVAVLTFFLYGKFTIEQTSIFKIRRSGEFEKHILLLAFIPRVIWTLLIYYIFMQNYGDAFGFESSDALFYDEFGQDFARAFTEGNFLDIWSYWSERIDVADMGYATYVGLIYGLTGNSIIVVRLMKCVWSTLIVLLVYRLAKRSFGDQTARVAAIFCALWPNFWYYCGSHLKETEMVFLCVLFVEQADQMLRSRQFTIWKIVPILLIAAALFTFRTVLALVTLLALLFSIVMSSSRVVSWGKRITVGGLAILLIGVTIGNQIQEQSRQLIETARGDTQEKNMEWRSTKYDGNSFAKYAGKSVFAPLIFTIPFPTMVNPITRQDVQQLLNGGNFVKNIISGFTVFAMVMLLLSGRWREHLLPLSFMLGYLVVLTMSNFAQSERFHQPATPFEFMFAAYGLSIAVTKPKYKRWFTYWCMLMFVAAIAWNWFKVAGRGLA